tara:strand:+ start:437 stop:1600 length:1164 start_codon:yes stop_codon:yes gene_type:complete
MSTLQMQETTWVAEYTLPLWEGAVPHAMGSGELHVPQLSVHLPPAGLANGCAMIINPGGGYRSLASDHEGLQVARWLNQRGIAAFVLRYRVGPEYPTSVSLLDGQRAVRLIRSRAAMFNIDLDRIGMLGFSAGGHLALAVATAGDDGNAQALDPIDQNSCRINFAVPVYAVSNGAKRGRKADEYTPTDEWVDAQTPPCFIVHTHDDGIVPASQATLIYEALLRVGVNAELHIFNDGEHGVGLAVGDPDVGEWPQMLWRWLRRRDLLSGQRRIALTGSLTCAGAPLGLAWLTLIPEDAHNPPARLLLHGRQDGAFVIAEDQGPMPGPHEVQIRWISRQASYDASGKYSMEQSLICVRNAVVAPDQPLDIRLQPQDFSPSALFGDNQSL